MPNKKRQLGNWKHHCQWKSRIKIEFCSLNASTICTTWLKCIKDKCTYLLKSTGAGQSHFQISFFLPWCGALHGSLAVKFDSCNNLLSSVHTMSVIQTASATVWNIKNTKITGSNGNGSQTPGRCRSHNSVMCIAERIQACYALLCVHRCHSIAYAA